MLVPCPMSRVHDTPRVSVVIATYNRAHLLAHAIQSLCDQTFRDFEVIVVDDASTDNTPQVIKEAFPVAGLRYMRHEKNRGPSAARNTGIAVAKGKYIAFQDSDDQWLREKLEKQVAVIETSPAEVGVVYTGFWKLRGKEKTYIPDSRIRQTEGWIDRELLKRNFIGTPTVLVKKEVLEEVGGFDERLRYLEDWDLWIRLAERCQFRYIPEPLVISPYSARGVNVQSIAVQIETLQYILRKHSYKITQSRESLAMWRFLVGSLYCEAGLMHQGRTYLLQATRSCPLRSEPLLWLVLSLLGQRLYRRMRALRQRVAEELSRRRNRRQWRGGPPTSP